MILCAWLAGSSPRVRGTVGFWVFILPHPRFIPACAGNRQCFGGGVRQGPVHPRVCGEQVASPRRAFPIHGSSPRVRGTVTNQTGYRNRQRFIPACAGNSFNQCFFNILDTVHPRVCGEQVGIFATVTGFSGSSPRVRGTEPIAYHRPRQARFIPACAGNSCMRTHFTGQPPVHPRVCGEQGDGFYTWIADDGSSPRVRGTVLRHLDLPGR